MMYVTKTPNPDRARIYQKNHSESKSPYNLENKDRFVLKN